MRFLDATLPTVAENLALDECLLLEAEAGCGSETLRVWEAPQWAVVLGAGCKLADDVNEEACRADGVPILRRASGGGTVLLGPGCLCFTLVLAYERDPALREIGSSYAYILGQLTAVLGGARAGTSDLAVDGLKFSGNAQQRKRDYLLHHGTMLYDFPIDRVPRYLREPARQPEYREQRQHQAFLTNLTMTALELRRRLQESWDAHKPTSFRQADVADLVAAKYAADAWTRRR